jgi:hypothetical protein
MAAALLCAIPALLTLAFILVNGVNVPFADEWWYASLVKSVGSGTASFASFWSPNNEHRMLIPRLEFSTLAVLTHWNSKAMMITGWLVVVVAMMFLFSEWKRIYSQTHPILWIVAVGTSAAALFSLVQIENWLWSFQFAFFFIQFAVVSSLIILCRSKIALNLRLLIAVILGVAASFSSAQGLLIWPAQILSMSLTNDSPGKKRVGLVFLLSSSAITFAVYFFGLPRTAELHLRPEQIIEKPQLPLFGFFGLVGNPLAHWISYEHLPHRAWFIGLSLTIVFIFLTWIMIRRRLSDAAPWLGLGMFAYSFCIMTTYGRLGMGYTGGFLASRYSTHVTLLIVALLALILIALNSADRESVPHARRRNRISTPAAFSTTFCVAALLVAGDVRSFKSGEIERQGRQLAKKLIAFSNYFDPAVDGTITGPFYPLCPLRCRMILGIGINQLSEAGYFRQLKDARFLHNETLATGAYRVGAKMEKERYLGIVEQGWNLSGAISLVPGLDADLVFIRPVGSEAFIAATEMRQSADRAEGGRSLTWRMFLSPFILSDPGIALEMWVYDRQTNAFVKVHQDWERWERADNSIKPGA